MINFLINTTEFDYDKLAKFVFEESKTFIKLKRNTADDRR